MMSDWLEYLFTRLDLAIGSLTGVEWEVRVKKIMGGPAFEVWVWSGPVTVWKYRMPASTSQSIGPIYRYAIDGAVNELKRAITNGKAS